MSSVVIADGEEVTMPSTTGIELTINSTETITVGDKAYTVYVIEGVEDTGGGSRRICVHKRFSQFVELHQVIRTALERSHTGVGAMPELPSKLQLSGGDEFIQRRRLALETYIRGIAILPETVTASILRSFLHTDTDHIRDAAERNAKASSSSAIRSFFRATPAASESSREVRGGSGGEQSGSPMAIVGGGGASPRAGADQSVFGTAGDQAALAPGTVVCDGYLFKQGRVFTTWRRRYFRMIMSPPRSSSASSTSSTSSSSAMNRAAPQLLCYYASPQDLRERGRLDLTLCTVAILDEKQRPNGRGEHCFGVFTPTRALLLEAENAEEMARWVKAFRGEEDQAIANISKDDFEMLSVLGRGHFAKVMLGRKRDTGYLYAIKVIHKRRVTERKHAAHTKTERRVLGKIRHPFIVSLHFAFQTEHKLYLALDYCPGGELFGLLQRQRKVEEEHGKLYAAQIVLALEYLHRLGIIYRDLKPENVLIDGKGNLRLADFGLSKEVCDGDRTYTFCGTPEYMCPEIILDQGHGQSVDFWALGVLIYELISGKHPFYTPNKDEMYRRILSVDPIVSKLLLPESQDILTQLLQKQVHRRLGSGPAGIDEVKRHPFFDDVDFKAVLAGKVKMPFLPNIKTDTDVSHFDVQFTREVPADSVVAGNTGAIAVRFDSFAFFTDDTDGEQTAWYDDGSDDGATDSVAGSL